MTRPTLSRRLACGLFFLLATIATPTAAAWRREVLIAGVNGAPAGVSPHGIAGISFGPDGALYSASFIGPGIYRFDIAAGTFREEIGGLDAAADDVAVAPDGTLAWTGLSEGTLWLRRPSAAPTVVARNLPMINPVAFAADGKILTGQITQPDTLLEVDPASGAVKVLARGLGGLNAFQPDGKGGLWLPLAERGAVGRFDFATEKLAIVAEGFGQPVAVKANSAGELFTIDWQTGRVFHVHADSGESKKIATVTPPLDNLAIGPDDTIYVSRPVDNAIIAIDPNSGAQRDVFRGVLAAPGGLAISTTAGKPTLLVSDAYGTRVLDLDSRKVTTPPFDLMVNAGSMLAATDTILVLTNVRRGTLVVIDRKTGRARHALGGFKAPMGVMIESDDSLLVADHASGEIIRVRPGQKPERATVFGGLGGPVGLAAAPGGRLYVTEAATGRLIDLDPATGDRHIISDRLHQPEGLAVLPDGRVAVADVGTRRLLIVGPGSGRIEEVATDLPIGAPFTRAPAPVFLPTGVATDSTGAIYLSCDRDNTILKFSPE